MGTQWIGPDEASPAPAGERGAYWLRREFAINRSAGATLRFSARGLVEIFLNGTRIGDELLPGYMQYEFRLPRRTYDVTEALRSGPNALVIVIADGWFRGQTGATRASDQWGAATSVWAEVEIDDLIVIQTGDGWTSAPSHITQADLIAGQTEDRRRFDPAVFQPGYNDDAWHSAVVISAPDAALVDYHAPPVRRIEELTPVAITTLRSGAHVVDFGQNINGWTRLSNLGPAGTELTLVHAEALGPDGDVTTDHLRVDFPFLPEPLAAGQVDHVISAGPCDVFEPRLTTHGFRYVRIEGHPGPLGVDDVRGIVVHSDLRRTGWFECDDERINRLHEAAVWSLRGNMCEIPTDCPQRERAGWTGDWQIFAPTAAYLYDITDFTAKWLADVRLAQRADGLIANHAPSSPAEGFDGPTAALHGSAGWGDVIVTAPWALYEAYGDPGPLADSWDAMQRWISFAEESARSGRSAARTVAAPTPHPHERYLWDTGFHWGEWLEPGTEVGDFPTFVAADKSEVATAYLHRSASIMAQIATVLGKSDESIDHYYQLAAACRDAWQQEFIDDDGSLVVQTQASHVRALSFGLVPDELRAGVADRLAGLVRDAGTTVGTGFLSTGMLLPALAENGHLDVAYDLLLQPNEPGWMNMIDHGATTVWERWNGIDADGVPHESLNHYSKGAVVSFLHRHVAGLSPTAPGYATFDVRPRPSAHLARASATLDAPVGRIAVEWRRSHESFTLRVEVPDGASAAIFLPSGQRHSVGPGSHEWSEPDTT